jgi:hypothetical protein
MMKNRISTAIAFLVLAISARAQLTQQQTKDFPIPAPKPYKAVKSFAYVGDYLYTSLGRSKPTENTYIRGISYNDYDYFLYGGVRGKRLYMTVSYNGTPPTNEFECGHTHLNYGATGYYTLNFRGQTYTGWTWLGGGTQSGTWNNTTKTCKRSVNNSFSATLPDLGWGTDLIDIAGTQISSAAARYIDVVMFAVMAPTHGAGDCNPLTNPATGFSFKACLDDARVNAWTLPL